MPMGALRPTGAASSPLPVVRTTRASACDAGRVAGVVAERGGDLRGGAAELFDPAVLQEIDRGRDGQAGHQLAAVVADAGGNAAHTEFEFLVVVGVAIAAYQGQFTLEVDGVGAAVVGVWQFR